MVFFPVSELFLQRSLGYTLYILVNVVLILNAWRYLKIFMSSDLRFQFNTYSFIKYLLMSQALSWHSSQNNR